jgi:hypothetical protein
MPLGNARRDPRAVTAPGARGGGGLRLAARPGERAPVLSSGCVEHGGGGGDVPRRRGGVDAGLARHSSTAVRRMGAGSDSGKALTALRKVEEGERQLNPKENRTKAARRWLSPWRGQLSGNGGSTKFPTRGVASSDGVRTLASAEGGGGVEKGVVVAA